MPRRTTMPKRMDRSRTGTSVDPTHYRISRIINRGVSHSTMSAKNYPSQPQPQYSTEDLIRFVKQDPEYRDVLIDSVEGLQARTQTTVQTASKPLERAWLKTA